MKQINIVDNRNKIKQLIGVQTDEKNDLIDVLIEESMDFFFQYTNIGELYMRNYESLIRSIAIVRYNKLSSEGLTSESYSGGSVSYIDGLPNEIVKQLNSIRRVKFI